jgi:hypothetical protein
VSNKNKNLAEAQNDWEQLYDSRSEQLINLQKNKELVPLCRQLLSEVTCGGCLEDRRCARYCLYKLGVSNLSEEIVNSIVTDSSITSLAPLARDICAQDGESEEKEIAARFLSQGITFEQLFAEYYGSVYQTFRDDEIEILNQFQLKLGRVAFIGAGALPVSAMLYAQITQQKLIAIEQNQEAFNLAQALINMTGFNSKLDLVHISAQDFNFSNIDTIVCANWLYQREGILNHISKNTNVRNFIFRTAPNCGLSFLSNSQIFAEGLEPYEIKPLSYSRHREGLALHSLIATRN